MNFKGDSRSALFFSKKVLIPWITLSLFLLINTFVVVSSHNSFTVDGTKFHLKQNSSSQLTFKDEAGKVMRVNLYDFKESSPFQNDLRIEYNGHIIKQEIYNGENIVKCRIYKDDQLVIERDVFEISYNGVENQLSFEEQLIKGIFDTHTKSNGLLILNFFIAEFLIIVGLIMLIDTENVIRRRFSHLIKGGEPTEFSIGMYKIVAIISIVLGTLIPYFYL